MSRAGSISTAISGLTMNDIPNLPGYRPNIGHSTISASFPKQYREFKESSTIASAEDDHFYTEEDDHSMQSFLQGSGSFKDATLSIASYPASGKSFNDISGRYSLKQQKHDRNNSRYPLPFTNEKTIPKFIVSDTTQGFICRFQAYFFEASPEDPAMPLRTRRVDILFYTLDGSIEIIEPRVPNSGSVQGIFLKRHKVPRSGSSSRTGIVASSSNTPSSRVTGKMRASSRTMRLPPLPGNATESVDDAVVTPTSSMERVKLALSRSVDSLPTTSALPQSRLGSSDNKPSFVSIDDFYAGAEVVMYQRRYVITDCDKGTKQFFVKNLQRPFGEPILNVPLLEYDFCYADTKQGTIDNSNFGFHSTSSTGLFGLGDFSRLTTAESSRRSSEMAQSHSSVDTRRLSSTQYAANFTTESKSFYQYDKMILRFFGVWDNRNQLYGDRIYVKVHYYLADNTFEVIPMRERNSGRDDIGIILKRTKIMKPSASQWNDERPGTAISSISVGSAGSVTDIGYSANPVGATPYHWRDLTIGHRLQIASVDILLTDADKFTREFYYSRNQKLPPAISIPSDADEVMSQTIPGSASISGIGDDISTAELMHDKRADYLCMNISGQYKPREGDPYALPPKGSLIAEAPFKDGAKLKELQGIILRYTAVMRNPSTTDLNRKFVIIFHCEDDSVEIKEISARNSGHVGGHFATRAKIENKFTKRFLCPKDLYLDAEININGVVFKIIDSDDLTLHYMENNCHDIWTSCDVQQVMKKIQAKQDILIKIILLTKGVKSLVVEYDDVEKLFHLAGLKPRASKSSETGSGINKQEVCTLCRAVDNNPAKQIKITKLLKFIMDYKYEDWATA